MTQNARGGRFVVGVSGASGTALAIATIRALAIHPDVDRVHVIATANAMRVATSELDEVTGVESILAAANLQPDQRARIEVHPDRDIGAIIASGSYVTDGMAVVPCSSGMLASIAHGISRGLIQRAADLMLKERRRLILGVCRSGSFVSLPTITSPPNE